MSETLGQVDPAHTTSRIDVTPMHLSITEGTHNVHLLETGDLPVILNRGQAPDDGSIPHKGVRGHLVIALGVDEDHDEVHYSVRSSDGFTWTEALAEAREVIALCERARAAGLAR